MRRKCKREVCYLDDEVEEKRFKNDIKSAIQLSLRQSSSLGSSSFESLEFGSTSRDLLFNNIPPIETPTRSSSTNLIGVLPFNKTFIDNKSSIIDNEQDIFIPLDDLISNFQIHLISAHGDNNKIKKLFTARDMIIKNKQKEKDNLDLNEDVCQICFEPSNYKQGPLFVVNCGLSIDESLKCNCKLHKRCLSRSLQINKSCPKCRKKGTNNYLTSRSILDQDELNNSNVFNKYKEKNQFDSIDQNNHIKVFDLLPYIYDSDIELTNSLSRYQSSNSKNLGGNSLFHNIYENDNYLKVDDFLHYVYDNDVELQNYLKSQ